MPPKDKDKDKEKVQVDEVLAAVIVADSFNRRFMPLTLDRPRCLLPLANVPIIEYTLEFLAAAGVQEVYVVCCAHSDLIKSYLKNSRWAAKPNTSSQIKVVPIVSQQLKSTGDALRDLDAQQLLKSDFILVSGDIVANMDLPRALEEHRTRRNTDKNAIMTMVVKAATPKQRSRAKGEEGIYVLDPASNECVQYRSLFPRKSKLKLDLDLFKSHPELQVRNDLIDCQIDICSVDVPALFTENFDYQDIRKHFVRGILESDILGKQIHYHILTDTYAARVRSTQMYDSISKDVMARWTYPMVPDTNIYAASTYSIRSPQIYTEAGVILAYTAVLQRNVVVGDKTEVGENSRIVDSVIGRGCKIGKNVRISGSYIWDGAIIGDDCIVERSILADNVVLLNGVVVEKGSILSFGVRVGPKFTVKEFTRLSAKKAHDNSGESSNDEDGMDNEAEDDDPTYDQAVVGVEGKGYSWEDRLSADDEDDEDDQVNHLRLLDVCAMARDVNLHDIIDENADEDSESEDDLSEIDQLERSHRELISTIERAFEENHTIDNLALELNTLKFADNLEFHDIRLTALPSVLSLVTDGKTLSTVVKRWGALLQRFAQDAEDQVDLLRILVEHCERPGNEEHAKLFVKVLMAFYEADICTEDGIFAWFKKQDVGRMKDAAQPFIKWLEEAEEESDDDEDSN
ncbi:hypothetical protein HK100_006953 [Physocladia obscura]|uniref:Translation initiation factor eIF2B subunit epsilon n=1 Tax=Physocladia obscura TaxID=109957 RepID=A0AAD5X8I7_9FUNG|nr:hypothetical protein HK100_006953 [Physocladia obscura]